MHDKLKYPQSQSEPCKVSDPKHGRTKQTRLSCFMKRHIREGNVYFNANLVSSSTWIPVAVCLCDVRQFSNVVPHRSKGFQRLFKVVGRFTRLRDNNTRSNTRSNRFNTVHKMTVAYVVEMKRMTLFGRQTILFGGHQINLFVGKKLALFYETQMST